MLQIAVIDNGCGLGGKTESEIFTAFGGEAQCSQAVTQSVSPKTAASEVSPHSLQLHQTVSSAQRDDSKSVSDGDAGAKKNTTKVKQPAYKPPVSECNETTRFLFVFSVDVTLSDCRALVWVSHSPSK